MLGTKYIHCKGSRNFNTARDRWWFVAVSNCNSTKGMQISYKFVMTNGPDNDILHHHFSADEFYLLPILLTATVIHLIILFMTIWSAIVLKARHLFHATYKLFLTLVLTHVSKKQCGFNWPCCVALFGHLISYLHLILCGNVIMWYCVSFWQCMALCSRHWPYVCDAVFRKVFLKLSVLQKAAWQITIGH